MSTKKAGSAESAKPGCVCQNKAMGDENACRRGVADGLKEAGAARKGIQDRAERNARRWRKQGIQVEADDLTQDTFLRYFEKRLADRVDPNEGTAVSLIHGVLRFISKEAVRAARRLPAQSVFCDIISDATEGPFERTLNRERWEAMKEGFGELTKCEQTGLHKVYGPLFLMRTCGTPKASDRSAACRALRKLREYARFRGLVD